MSKDAAGQDNAPYLELGAYSGFAAYQAPLPLSWIAAGRGYADGPWSDNFTYAEIGCGSGLALGALADAYPRGHFIGIETDAAQAARASSLARDTGLTNMEVHHKPTLDPRTFALPPCNIITIAGLFSWLSVDERRNLAAGLAAFLAPGGVLCVQYGALPGNGHVDTVYTLLKAVAGEMDGDGPRKLVQAMPRVAELIRTGGVYFQQTPAATELLQRITAGGPALAAAEIFRTGRNSLFHTEVAGLMTEIGLAFAGNGQIELNHLELIAPPTMRTVIESAKSSEVRELMIDYARNTSARVDLYVKPGPSGRREAGEGLLPFLVARLSPGPETLLRQQLAQRTGVDFTAGLYDDLLNTVGQTPVSVGELLEMPAIRKHARNRTLRAIQFLVAQRFLQIVRTRNAIPTGPLPAVVRLGSPFNEKLFKDALGKPESIPLAGPVLGQRVLASAKDRWQLHVVLGGTPEEVFEAVKATGLSLSGPDGKPATLEAFRDGIMKEIEAFRGREALQLYKLGILKAA